MNFTALAWSLVIPPTIERCFVRAGITKDVGRPTTEDDEVDNYNSDDDDESFKGFPDEDWERLHGEGTFEDYVTVDNDIETTEEMTIDDILDSRVIESSDEEEEAEPDTIRPPATLASALENLEELRCFLSTTDDVDGANQSLINQMHKKIFLVHEKKSKQPKLTSFFARR
jgi:hypothetical protein